MIENQKCKLVNKPIVFSRLAKNYQFDVFYEREFKLWNDNPFYKGMPLQAWLYLNRFKYLGKTPNELSLAEIMRGFTISGILKGFTVFNTSLMHKFVSKYGITSIYDPCAGWGERMIYCYYNDIDYYGVDINTKLKPGYEKLMSDYNMTKQHITFCDAAKLACIYKVDTVLTCPPYGSTERYSDWGSENLSDTDFINWWQKVVKNTLTFYPEYFCLQINQKWRERMIDVIKSFGFEQIDEFFYTTTRSSHLTRRNGIDCKKEYESLIVMKRV